jgi:hypothetical protein
VTEGRSPTQQKSWRSTLSQVHRWGDRAVRAERWRRERDVVCWRAGGARV